jgi:hypothetical protein
MELSQSQCLPVVLVADGYSTVIKDIRPAHEGSIRKDTDRSENAIGP